jgi:electron transport complex protein RnfC
MVENASQLVEAIAVVRRVLTPKFTVLAVEAEKSGAMARMKVAAEAAGEPMRFAVVDNKYPQSDERQLIRATTGREVPSGHPGIDVGCVTISVATLLAIWDAVVTRKPLVERIVTVAGGAVGSPANLKVRLGTPIGSLLKECGLDPARVSSIVVGGPMRGHATSDLRLPVTKTTDAVLALTKSEVHSAPETDCIQCGRCSRSCPMGLNPERLYKLVEHRHVLRAVDEGLFDCTECGACSYVCPARIPLLDHLISGKGQVKAP